MNSFDTRYQLFSSFSMFDYKSMENNLAVMATKGWKIEHAGTFLWKFKKVQPSNKKFCVIFSRDASENNPIPWEKVTRWKQMQIFCADEEAAPLETDEAARLESVRTVMNKTFIPAWAMGLLAMLIIAFSNGIKYFGNSPYSDEGTVWIFLIGLYGAFMVGVGLLGYMYWVKVSRKKISEGGSCISIAWHRKLLNVLLVGFLVIFIGYLLDTKAQIGEGIVFYIILYMAAVLAVISLINFFSQYLKEKGCAHGTNIILSTIVGVILIIVMVVVMNIIEAIMATI